MSSQWSKDVSFGALESSYLQCFNNQFSMSYCTWIAPRSSKNEGDGAQLRLVAEGRQCHWGNRSQLPIVYQDKDGSSSSTPTSLGLALQSLAAYPYRFCYLRWKSLPDHDGCSLEMAWSSWPNENHKFRGYNKCRALYLCKIWFARTSHKWQWSAISISWVQRFPGGKWHTTSFSLSLYLPSSNG